MGSAAAAAVAVVNVVNGSLGKNEAVGNSGQVGVCHCWEELNEKGYSMAFVFLCSGEPGWRRTRKYKILRRLTHWHQTSALH